MGRNTHARASLFAELEARFADLIEGYTLDGGIHPTSGDETVAMPPTAGYVVHGGELRYVEETLPRTLTYDSGDGTYWLILHTDVASAVGGWTRIAGTHYLWQLSATMPPIPDGALLLMQTTVALGAISAVVDYRVRTIATVQGESFSYTTAMESHWRFLRGGSLQPASGVTISHQGTVDAGRFQVFDLTEGGLIGFPNGATVSAAWWGAMPGVASAAAIESALKANPTKMHVLLDEGTYILEQAVLFPTGLNLDTGLSGKGSRKTILQRDPAYTGILLQIGVSLNPVTPTRVYHLRSFGLDGLDKAVGTIGLRGYRIGEGEIEDVYVTRCEKAIWNSGGSHNLFHRSRLEGNTTGLIIDNNDAVSPTFYVVEDCWFRTNDTHLHIDGNAHPTRLSRNFSFRHTAFENHSLVSGADLAIRITQAQQVVFDGCWFEGNSRHVLLEGGDAAKVLSFLVWRNCNFGDLNPNAIPGTTAFQADGAGSSDGLGCLIYSCRIGEGEYQFNQTIRFGIQEVGLFGTAVLTGNAWYAVTANDTESTTYSERESKTNWSMQRVNKDDGTTTSRRNDVLSTASTTDATQTTITQRVINDGGTALVIASVVAKSVDNTINAGYLVAGLFVNAGGTVSLIGSVADVIPPIENAAGMAFTLDASTNTVRARATGVAATTIRWQVEWKVLQIHGA